MGSLARAHRRRQARTLRLPDKWYGTQVAWCQSEDDLPEARQRTHDALIETMAERRTGAVQWRWWTGYDATSALSTMGADPNATDEHAGHYGKIAALLREKGGYLVLAIAPGKRP